MSNLSYDTAQAPIGVGFFDQNAFKKKAHLILVLETGLAGVDFAAGDHEDGHAAFFELIDSLEPGTELRLFREPDNRHDKWAVPVFTTDDVKVGYLSRYKNETIARLMDEGKKFVAYVAEKLETAQEKQEWEKTHAPTERYRVPVKVYMEE